MKCECGSNVAIPSVCPQCGFEVQECGRVVVNRVPVEWPVYCENLHGRTCRLASDMIGRRAIASLEICIACDGTGDQACRLAKSLGSVDCELKPMAARLPKWVEVIAIMRMDGEVGVGDTLARILSYAGGEWFKWIAAKAGVNCGCKKRQAALNEEYPYSSIS